MLVFIIILSIIFLIVFFVVLHNKNKLKKYSQHNLIVFGEKGSGKSLMFSCIAKLSKFGYVSNTDFGFKKPHYLIDPKDVNCGENTYEDFLKGNIKPFDKQPLWEKKSVLLDDAGVYLPSWEDNLLKKTYKGMPIAFAVWRHLYDAPIHINSQDCERVWKLLREQQGRYIYCKGVIKLPFGFFIIRARGYNVRSTAEIMAEPMCSGILNHYQKANAEQIRCTLGKIDKLHIFGRFKHHTYNSRYFHNVCFKADAPQDKEFKKIFKIEKKCFTKNK